MMMKLKAIPAIVASALVAEMIVVVSAQSSAEPSDTEAYYKSRCVTCHGKKAEKKFDASLNTDLLVEVVLKGKKATKPPQMPGYAEKGVSAEQAKELVDYMKQLKAAQ